MVSVARAYSFDFFFSICSAHSTFYSGMLLFLSFVCLYSTDLAAPFLELPRLPHHSLAWPTEPVSGRKNPFRQSRNQTTECANQATVGGG